MQAVLDPVLDPGFDPVGAALAAAVDRLDAADADADGEWLGQWPGLDAGLAALLDRADTPSELAGLRSACEGLAAAAPGPDTLAALGVLSEPGVLAGLDEGCRVLLAVGWERAAAWVAACTAPVLVAADDAAGDEGCRHGPDGRWVSDELRTALRWSAVTAGRRVDTARALTGSFGATLAVLAAGAISPVQGGVKSSV